MEYKVLTGQSDSKELAIKELEIKVNKHLETGYKPQGGVSTTQIGSPLSHIFTIAQAMVKE